MSGQKLENHNRKPKKRAPNDVTNLIHNRINGAKLSEIDSILSQVKDFKDEETIRVNHKSNASSHIA